MAASGAAIYPLLSGVDVRIVGTSLPLFIRLSPPFLVPAPNLRDLWMAGRLGDMAACYAPATQEQNSSTSVSWWMGIAVPTNSYTKKPFSTFPSTPCPP